jgi:hypothetical protein
VAIFPELAEILAVGVPELTFKTANLAEAVDVPPINRSKVLLIGWIVPLAIFQFNPEAVLQLDQVGVPAPPDTKH